MELNQLQVVYQESQDRLLLRIAATDEAGAHELQAWLTRRFVGNLWAALQKALAVQLALSHPDAIHASAELIDMAHQSALSTLSTRGDFGEQFRAGLTPHGALNAPILVAEAQFHVTAKEPMRINFMPAEGVGVEIAFTETELHGFCTLLQEGATVACWDLVLQLGSSQVGQRINQADAGFEMTMPTGPRVLN